MPAPGSRENNPFAARDVAIAMNARGRPGIVLASVAFDAGIINEDFYSVLVLLAIVTSLLAGSWLEQIVARGRPLRGPVEPARVTLPERAGEV